MNAAVILIPLLLIALAACSTNSHTVSPPAVEQPAPAPIAQNDPTPPIMPIPPAAPMPTAPPRPAHVAWTADWSGPDLRCALSITGDVPPIDSIPAGSDAVFGTFYDPSYPDSLLLTKPGPNKVYTCDGKLTLDSEGMGFQVITRQTFSRAGVISSQAKLTCLKTYSPSAWGGLVGQYNGDAKHIDGPSTLEEQEANMWKTGEWRGIYFMLRDGQLTLSYVGPSTDNSPGIPAEYGVEYTCRIDYENGRWTHLIMNAAGEVLYHVVEDPAAPLTADLMVLGNDPHFDIATGDLRLVVGEADVRRGGGPSQAGV